MNIKLSLFPILLLLASSLYAQQGESMVLEAYIDSAMENNLAVKQRESDWRTASSRLKEAKGLFYPDISLNARFSVADGGRIIDFPVGDLLNPVYSTLNSLTGSNGFPLIENAEVPFLRPQEHETKIRLVQPLLNTQILYNSRIQQNQLDIQYADLESYKRLLVFEVKQAYYNYLKSVELLQLLENTREVLEENLRVNQKLLANQMVARDAVLRSESELRKMDENIAAAKGGLAVSSSYFNFLLNRELDAEITIDGRALPEIPLDLQTLTDNAIREREEIKKLNSLSQLASNNVKLNNSSSIPEIVAVVDYGFEGENYSFTSDDDFLMASFVLQWDIFKGFQQRSKKSQARIMEEKVIFQRAEVESMIKLEVINNWNDLAASYSKMEASESNKKASREAFRITEKRFNQNQASLLEFIDARNNMTSADQNHIINSFDFLIKYAALEKSAATYSLETK